MVIYKLLFASSSEKIEEIGGKELIDKILY